MHEVGGLVRLLLYLSSRVRAVNKRRSRMLSGGEKLGRKRGGYTTGPRGRKSSGLVEDRRESTAGAGHGEDEEMTPGRKSEL